MKRIALALAFALVAVPSFAQTTTNSDGLKNAPLPLGQQFSGQGTGIELSVRGGKVNASFSGSKLTFTLVNLSGPEGPSNGEYVYDFATGLTSGIRRDLMSQHLLWDAVPRDVLIQGNVGTRFGNYTNVDIVDLESDGTGILVLLNVYGGKDTRGAANKSIAVVRRIIPRYVGTFTGQFNAPRGVLVTSEYALRSSQFDGVSFGNGINTATRFLRVNEELYIAGSEGTTPVIIKYDPTNARS